MIAIIDYGSGNLHSVAKACTHALRENGQEERSITITNRPEVAFKADYLILPGVGSFKECAAGLRALDGMEEALREIALTRARPLLGICVGMQLMADEGEEHETTRGLGWIAGRVVALQPGYGLKIPHMGWNNLEIIHNHHLFDGLNERSHAYFVHSYHFVTQSPDHVALRCDYGTPLTAAVLRDTIIGTQFHPEKSQASGLRFLSNFLAWRP